MVLVPNLQMWPRAAGWRSAAYTVSTVLLKGGQFIVEKSLCTDCVDMRTGNKKYSHSSNSFRVIYQ